ncbi:MAG: AMP-binding protein, partial [Actinomycetota bacterium]|nr:AMP-binding protein [Actinomycetota bacterium]
MRRVGIDDYRELVAWSTEDVGRFWNEVVADLGIDFFEPYEQILDESKGPRWPRWFVGGRINLAYNCVDRHAANAATTAAILWEGEDGDVRTLSYGELARSVAAVAAGLQSLGVAEGDAVGVYMPMVPEAVIAAYACARIGAIYLPIFSGFGAPAIATRLNDASAKVLVTADAFWRRGHKVAMKHVADQA